MLFGYLLRQQAGKMKPNQLSCRGWGGTREKWPIFQPLNKAVKTWIESLARGESSAGFEFSFKRRDQGQRSNRNKKTF